MISNSSDWNAPLAQQKYPVLLVDDDPFNRHGVRLYFEQNGFEIQEAGDESEALRLAEGGHWRAALIDLAIPRRPGGPIDSDIGASLGWRLKTMLPDLGVVFFSAYEDHLAEFLEKVRSGVRGVGYKLKGCQPTALLTAVFEVMAGRVVLDGWSHGAGRGADADLRGRVSAEELPYAKTAIRAMRELTPRLREVARLLASSYTTSGIAQELRITSKTAENYVGLVYERAGLTEMGRAAPHLRKAVVLAKAWAIANEPPKDVGR